MRKIANLLVAVGTIFTVLFSQGALDNQRGTPADLGTQNLAMAKKPVEKGRNVYSYKSTYVQDPNEKFQEFSDTYDPQKRIRKKTQRKKVLRKVKKIKKESQINTSKARPLNYVPEKNIKENEQRMQALR